MYQVSRGSNNADTYKNRSYKGATVTVYVEKATNDTELVAADVNLKDMQMQVLLLRNGKEIPIFNDSFKPIAANASFENASWEHILPGVTDNTVFDILVAANTNVKETGIMSFYIPFGQVINLRGNDEIYFEFSCGASGLSENVSTNSKISCDLIEGIGLEQYVPRHFTKSIAAGETTRQFDVGNTTRVAFLNYDKSSNLAASTVVSQVSINTDRERNQFQYQELIGARRQSQFQLRPIADYRYQSHLLLNEFNAKGVLSFNFAANSITAGNNVLYFIQTVPSDYLRENIAKNEVHTRQNLALISQK